LPDPAPPSLHRDDLRTAAFEAACLNGAGILDNRMIGAVTASSWVRPPHTKRMRALAAVTDPVAAAAALASGLQSVDEVALYGACIRAAPRRLPMIGCARYAPKMRARIAAVTTRLAGERRKRGSCRLGT